MLALGTATHAQDQQGASASAPSATTQGASAADVASPAEGATGSDNMIVVTGSRIARPELSLPNPVESFTAASIEQSGDTNLTDFLLDSPALVGSTGNALSSGSNTDAQEVGLNLLNLRNLGTQRTLVLVNGRRHVNAYPGESSVDINTIPLDLIDRVDVLTGGASAIYGADAVSGVVNFVLKRNFEGISARGQVGISQRGDAGNRYGSIVAGKNFADGRGNVALSYEYYQQQRFSETQRSYLGNPSKRLELLQDPSDFDADDPNVYDRRLYNNVGWADSAPNGAVDIDLDGVPDFDGDGRPYDGGTFLPGSGGRAINGSSNTPTAGYFGDQSPRQRRHNVNLLSSFEFDKSFRMYFEGKYFRSKSKTYIQPTFDFYRYLTPDNYYVQERFGDAAPDGVLVSRDNFDFGRSTQYSDRETIRTVIGADGSLTDGDKSGHLRYDLSFNFGQSKAKTKDRGRLADRYFASLDAVVDPATGQPTCRINLPGETIIDPNNYAGVFTVNGVPATGLPLTFSPGDCRPITLLGSGLSDPDAVSFSYVDDLTRARNRQYVVSASVTGDLGFLFELPGGPIGFAVGGEYRKETTRNISSAFAQIGAFDAGDVGNIALPSGGSYDVKEVFGEVNLPILKDQPFAETLAVGAAYRFSKYSTVGSTSTWKVDGIYAPIKDVSFRGTYSQAVRAPNISELFDPTQGTLEFLTDPCDPSNIGEGTEFRAANCQAQLAAAGLTPAQIADFSPATDAEQSTSQPGQRGGNRNLREEKAKTWTAGIVLRPSFVRGLTLSADWYNIKIKNAINTPDADDIFKNCVDAPTLNNVFCGLYSRSGDTGFINNFLVQAQNVASFKTSGLDVTANYTLPTSRLGTFNFRLVGGYLKDLTFVPSAGAAPDQDKGESYAPRFVGTFDMTWTLGGVTLNYGLAWQDKTRRFTTEQIRANPDISDPKYFYYKERWEHDLQVAFDVNKTFTFYTGVNNFTDQKPAVAALAGYPVSAVGRFFYAGAKVKMPEAF